MSWTEGLQWALLAIGIGALAELWKRVGWLFVRSGAECLVVGHVPDLEMEESPDGPGPRYAFTFHNANSGRQVHIRFCKRCRCLYGEEDWRVEEKP